MLGRRAGRRKVQGACCLAISCKMLSTFCEDLKLPVKSVRVEGIHHPPGDLRHLGAVADVQAQYHIPLRWTRCSSSSSLIVAKSKEILERECNYSPWSLAKRLS